MEFITIESHFGVPDNCIRANTRNKCSEDFVEIINQIAQIVFPEDKFEICLLPPAPGSYTDIIKIFKAAKKEFKKNPVAVTMTTGAALGALGALAFSILTYVDSHTEHLHNKEMWEVEDAAKCLALKEQIASLSETYTIEILSDEQIKKVCGDINIKKLKNNRYKILEGDEMIASDTTVLKNASAEVMIQKKVERNEFLLYVEDLPEEEGIKENSEGVIELISLVVKQQKEGKGIPWKGTYYGEEILQNGEVILEDGELVSFFMQDETFKQRIKNNEVVFGSGDNISAKFDVKFSRNLDGTWSKTIYVNEVQKFNEVIIEHKPKPIKTDKNLPPENQQELFG